MAEFRTKRVYEPVVPDDGLRVLVDGLWPRGLKKSDAAIDHWLKDAAPSAELRRWYGHAPERWPEFRRRYAEELEGRDEAVRFLRDAAREDTVTLLFAARDETRNNAVALKAWLDGETA